MRRMPRNAGFWHIWAQLAHACLKQKPTVLEKKVDNTFQPKFFADHEFEIEKKKFSRKIEKKTWKNGKNVIFWPKTVLDTYFSG